MDRTVLWGRIAVTRRTLALAVGDALMIAVFVAGGQLRHSGSLGAGIETFGHFAIGWVLVAIPGGAYTADAVASKRRAGSVAVIGWTGGAVLAQLLRLVTGATTEFVPIFAAVTIGVGGFLLVGWRLVAATVLT